MIQTSLETVSTTSDKVPREKISFIEQGALFEKAVKDFIALRTLLESLVHSKCHNIIDFLCDSVTNAEETLKGIVTKELEDSLKMISYPFIGPEVAMESKDEPVINNEQRVKDCVRWLLQIDLESVLKLNSLYVNDRIGSKCAQTNYFLLISIIVKPFEKRFKFHFFANRKTNNLEKVNLNSFYCIHSF